MNIWRAIHQSTQGRIVLAGVLFYAAWQVMLSVMAVSYTHLTLPTKRIV